jgi:hypothetical protein
MSKLSDKREDSTATKSGPSWRWIVLAMVVLVAIWISYDYFSYRKVSTLDGFAKCTRGGARIALNRRISSATLFNTSIMWNAGLRAKRTPRTSSASNQGFTTFLHGSSGTDQERKAPCRFLN